MEELAANEQSEAKDSRCSPRPFDGLISNQRFANGFAWASENGFRSSTCRVSRVVLVIAIETPTRAPASVIRELLLRKERS
eukprot:COSAG02_NODE_53271_length_303_cov_0.401961_1_plen_80_part_01